MMKRNQTSDFAKTLKVLARQLEVHVDIELLNRAFHTITHKDILDLSELACNTPWTKAWIFYTSKVKYDK